MLPWILNLGMTGDGGTTVAQTTPVSVAVTVNAGSVVSATTVAQAAAIAVAITVNAGSVDASTIVAQTTPVAVAVTVNAGTVSSSKLIEQTAPVAVAVTALGGDVTLGGADTAATGGGRGRKSVSKYPRRVVIGGVVYWVNSAAEERRLLLEYREKVEAEALELAITDAPAKEVAKARVKVVRAARRLEQVDTREADWLEYLRQEDDEIVSIVLH